MARILLCLPVIVLIGTFATPVHGQSPLYYSFTDPQGVPPPGSPWTMCASTCPLPSNTKVNVWIGQDNNCVQANTTHWTVDFVAPMAQSCDIKEAWAYCGGPKYNGTTSQVNITGGRRFEALFNPQPDWQVMRISLILSESHEEQDVDSCYTHGSFCCYNSTALGEIIMLDNSWFGLAEVDNLNITQIVIVPLSEEVPVDPSFAHVLCAGTCEEDSSWRPEIVYVDPCGTPLPLGGVSFAPPDRANGLMAGEHFRAELRMSGPADTVYAIHTYNDLTGTWAYNQIHVNVGGPPDPIPTLTEWGMIIFTVLLFGYMAWVIIRRRRRVNVGI